MVGRGAWGVVVVAQLWGTGLRYSSVTGALCLHHGLELLVAFAGNQGARGREVLGQRRWWRWAVG